MSVIPFDDIVPGSSVRFTVIEGEQYLSVRDLIMVMCGQTSKHALQTWYNLSEENKSEVSKFLGNFKFPGQGQSEQPVIKFEGALKLLMFLPGEKAKQYRSMASNIIMRYYAEIGRAHV